MVRRSRRASGSRRTRRRSRHSTRKHRHTRGRGKRGGVLKQVYWIPSSSKPVSKKDFDTYTKSQHSHRDGPNVAPHELPGHK